MPKEAFSGLGRVGPGGRIITDYGPFVDKETGAIYYYVYKYEKLGERPVSGPLDTRRVSQELPVRSVYEVLQPNG